MKRIQCQPQLKESQLVNVCYYTKFEPVIYGDAKGFEADLLKAIFKYWNVDYKFHPVDDYEDIWLKPGEKNSIFDIAAAGIDPNSRNKSKLISYSVSTANYSQSLLIKRKFFDDGLIKNYRSLGEHSLKIGVIGNTTGEKFARQRAKENMVASNLISLFETEDEMLESLKQDKIFAIARGSIGNEFQESINPEFKTIELKSFGEVMSYTVEAKNDQLLNALNSAINIITNNNKLSYPEWLKDHEVFLRSIDV
jgi:ABC-type amino acid transport substrate-binding protein